MKKNDSAHFSRHASLLVRAFLIVSLLGSFAPASADAGETLAGDDFLHGLGAWRVERQAPDSQVEARDGALDVLATAGVTIWFRQPFEGDYEISFTATPIKASFPGYPERVSDLNLFWNASTLSGEDPAALGADGSLAAYNPLRLYYVGFGANGNQTTRLRRYDGSAARPQIAGYADAAERTPADTLGELPPYARLRAGEPVRVRLQSIAVEGGALQRFLADDLPVFSWTDPAPYRRGWFALRTTTSHFRITGFKVIRL